MAPDPHLAQNESACASTCAFRLLIWQPSRWRSAMPARRAAFSSCRVALLLASRCCILRSAFWRSWEGATQHITHVGRGKGNASYVNLQLHRVRSSPQGVVAVSTNSNISLLRRHLLILADLLRKLPREEPRALLRPLQQLV